MTIEARIRQARRFTTSPAMQSLLDDALLVLEARKSEIARLRGERDRGEPTGLEYRGG